MYWVSFLHRDHALILDYPFPDKKRKKKKKKRKILREKTTPLPKKLKYKIHINIL
jgi:hypothetical protein